MTEEHQQGKGMSSTVNLIVSVITHVLLLAPVLYIVAYYFENYKFFSWHPICMAVGVGLVMTEAVFSISGEANLTSRVSRLGRVTIHWTLLTAGLALMIIGFIIVLITKTQNNKYHFTSNHGKVGLVAIILALVVAMFGIVANNTRWLYPRVRPVLIKVSHAFGGIAATILLLAATITGIYSHSFKGSETGKSLVFASFFIAGVLILVKPIIGAASRSRVICKSYSKPNTGSA